MKFPERLKKPGYRYLAGIALGVALLTSPKWGLSTLRRLSYFHVRKIEIRGVRYLQPDDVVARLRVPAGFLLLAAFAWFSRPTAASLMGGIPISAIGLALRGWAAGHLAKNQRLAQSGP